jgi:hypothetical protein
MMFFQRACSTTATNEGNSNGGAAKSGRIVTSAVIR